MSWFFCSCDWKVGKVMKFPDVACCWKKNCKFALNAATWFARLQTSWFLPCNFKLITRVPGNPTATLWMICHIFLTGYFKISCFRVCGPVGDSSRAGFGPRAWVYATLLYTTGPTYVTYSPFRVLFASGHGLLSRRTHRVALGLYAT